MLQPNNDLPFFDYIMEDSEHLIEDDGFRVGKREWSQSVQPMDASGSAFTYTETQTGLQTSSVYSGTATTCSAVPAGLNAASPIFDRLSPTNDSLYSSASSPAVSAHSSIALYEYAQQQNSPDPYLGSYVSPASLQDSSSSGVEFYPWVNAGAGTLGDTMMLGNPDSMVLTSPATGFEPLTGTPEAFTESELSIATQQGFRPQYECGNSEGGGGGAPRNKRAKTGRGQDVTAARSLPSSLGRPLLSAGPSVAGPSNAGGSTGQAKTKLRSASRTSKNVAHRPDETSDERKSRNAHNLVEKQYRNRLNAQFEGLLNVLPESLRSPGGTGGPSDSDLSFDLGERRLSKGDVLELSTRYIRMLERDRHKLERERDDLTKDIESLRAMFTNQGMPGPEGSGKDNAA